MTARLLAAALAALSVTAAHATSQTIGFEGLGWTSLGSSSSYAGLSWTGAWGDNSWIVTPANDGIFVGQDAHSGSEYAWSNGGTTLDLATPGNTRFDVNSLWTRGGNAPISFVATGYANGVAVYTMDFSEGTTYTLNMLGFRGIDKLELSNQSTNLLLDDIDVSSPSAVPEPGSLGMLLAGVTAIAVTVRRRKV